MVGLTGEVQHFRGGSDCRFSAELASWVLGFGPDVWVLKPPALRRRISKVAQQVAKVNRNLTWPWLGPVRRTPPGSQA